MKLLVFLFLSFSVLFLACTPTAKKLTKTPTSANFPEDWLGRYEGNLELFRAGRGKGMELPLTIIISKTDTANRWRWYSKALYNGKEIIKDYALTRNDSMPKNHFIMDENNGIFLDRILIDDAFYDFFEIGNVGIYGITRKVGDDIHFEIASFPLNSKTYSTYGEGADLDTVTSFKVMNTQKVLLKRVKE